MSSKFWKITGGIIAAICLLVGAIFYFTSGLVDAADEMFSDLNDKNYQRAYSQLSQDFRPATSFDEFKYHIEENGLDDIVDTSWSARSISGGTDQLEGTISTRDRGEIPLTLYFVSEDGDWKIQRLNRQTAGIVDQHAEPPSKTEQNRLIKQTLLTWNDAILRGDFTGFLVQTSKPFQAQTSNETLTNTFRSFIDGKVDISPIADHDPIPTAMPTFDEEGSLILEGYFDSRPRIVQCKLTYLLEAGVWKIIGIKVNMPLGIPSPT